MDNDIIDALGINETEEKETQKKSSPKKSSLKKSSPQNNTQFIKFSKIFLYVFLFICSIGGFIMMAEEYVVLGLTALLSGLFLFILAYAIICILENTEKNS